MSGSPRVPGRRRWLAHLCLLLGVLAVVACATTPAPVSRGVPAASDAPAANSAAASAPPAREKVRIAHVSNGATMAVIDVARQAGMFDRYGVDAELQLIPNPISVAAML